MRMDFHGAKYKRSGKRKVETKGGGRKETWPEKALLGCASKPRIFLCSGPL